MKNRIRAAAAGLAVGAVALTGTAISGGEAAAKVPSRNYTWYGNSLGTPSQAPATVRGNTLIIYAPGSKQFYRIVPTRSGGYFDAMGTRYILHKRARGVLSGPAQWGGLVIGNNKLVPRR
ncbi:hypothetical protein GCM10010528_23280 [Gordonia defluvii]|uniref:Uncharacterized protein n=1 Tax=Gordonia defluvii TaxID=283718 RepID=A0ABP6LGC2_9ACTN